MTRPLRIEFPGAFYHITSRGNARQNIFCSNDDREQLLFLFAKTIAKNNWRCHAYCLMDNHYHLLIETIDPTLSRGMQYLNGGYTQWHNATYKNVGHIFQGRFKAFLIEEHIYLLNAARYIVLNPVRAKIVELPEDYPWSSHRILVGLNQSPDWFTTTNILEQFSTQKMAARRRYEQFVLEGIGQPSPFADAGRKCILGTTQFVSEIRDKIEARLSENDNDIVIAQKLAGRPTLEQLFDEVKNQKERDAAIKLALNFLQYTSTAVGNFIGLHSATIRNIARG
ncbi:MAG: transposase [Patescibacteria group bacterium]